MADNHHFVVDFVEDYEQNVIFYIGNMADNPLSCDLHISEEHLAGQPASSEGSGGATAEGSDRASEVRRSLSGPIQESDNKPREPSLQPESGSKGSEEGTRVAGTDHADTGEELRGGPEAIVVPQVVVVEASSSDESLQQTTATLFDTT